jgi:hypothetical protein
MANTSLGAYLDRHREIISRSNAEQFPVNHEAFIAGLREYSPDELFCEHILEFAPFFSGSQKRYLAYKEKLANQILIQDLQETSGQIGEQLTTALPWTLTIG